MAKKKSYQESPKVRRLRTMIIGGFAVLLIVVGGIGIWNVFSPMPAGLDEGRHYDLIGDVDASRGDTIVVTEYFSYGCVHCRNFEPQVESWSRGLPDDVRFERVPVSFSSAWRNLARAFYAAEELGILERNHRRIFDAIHVSGLTLSTPEAVAQLIDGQGTDAETFRRTMQSPAVRRRLDEAENRVRAAGIMAVPTLVIDDRYRITSGELSRRQVLDVADRLIAREREARRAAE